MLVQACSLPPTTYGYIIHVHIMITLYTTYVCIMHAQMNTIIVIEIYKLYENKYSSNRATCMLILY